MDQTKAALYADALTVVLCLGSLTTAITAHLAYRATAQELSYGAPAGPIQVTGQTVPYEVGNAALFYITQAESDHLATLNIVSVVSVVLLLALAGVIAWRGSIARLRASFSPWRQT